MTLPISVTVTTTAVIIICYFLFFPTCLLQGGQVVGAAPLRLHRMQWVAQGNLSMIDFFSQ